MNDSGYSGTPLAKKLGYKPGFRVCLKNPPDDLMEWMDPIPEGVQFSSRLSGTFDLIHFFTKSRSELVRAIDPLKSKIKQDGMIWISWPKKASKVATDMTEDVIREVALPIGLVDIKVCAVDSTWSGLKLVIRKELRK